MIFHHSEDGGDTSGTVRWLSPSSACNKLSFIGSVSSRGHAGRFDVVIEVNWRWKFDQGDVIGQITVIPTWMGPAIKGSDFNTVWLRGFSDIVSSSHDIKVRGTISTMSSSKNVILRDEGSTTEPSIINEEGNLPGPLVFLCFVSSDDSSFGVFSERRSFDSTSGFQIDLSSLLGCDSILLSFLHSLV